MKRTLRIIACALVIGALAACSHKNPNAPLSYVPADTPYLVANLKPMDEDMRDLALKQANEQLPVQLDQMRHVAAKLDAENQHHAAAVVRAIIHEMDGRTIQQAAHHIGVAMDGLFAFYGEGLSPVARLQLSNPAAFKAFVARLEKAAGTSMESAKLAGLSYRQMVFGTAVKLRFVVAVEHKQAVLGLLPADADTSLLRSVLGISKPHDSVQSTGKLATLVKAKGYEPYSVAYIDLTQWPALIAGAKDPMVHALLAAAPQLASKIPARCESDFARIASRVPMVSSGVTEFSAKRMDYRINIGLAADIAKAFADIDVKLPGLGTTSSAPLDMALALPVKEIRTFWMAQAEAVAAKPFTCPALAALNGGMSKLRMNLIKTAMPPVNGLRGVRLVLDSLELPADGSPAAKPQVSGQVLIASDNPQGLLAMAQLAAPPLRDLTVPTNGKPVALPAKLTAMAGGKPAWVAMNKHVLGVAIGQGEAKQLAASMKQSGARRGQISSFHLDGKLYRKWLSELLGHVNQSMDKLAADKQDPEAQQNAKDFKKNMQMVMQQARHIDAINQTFQANDHGLVINVDVRRH